ncbi:T6SS effector phospholipase Tle3 domain-containing protein [Janthinobacterium sp. Mn2066]|uniref:T6SS effector phospholipase Tle3 domain-containing protein n=1 Tax=Janthinobacterium sp. Mn2066 TaxID=3395264 RepID=UPI003BC132CA
MVYPKIPYVSGSNSALLQCDRCSDAIVRIRPDMWNKGLFSPFDVGGDPVCPLMTAPGRMYMVLAAKRLAVLISMIRDYDSNEAVSIVAHKTYLPFSTPTLTGLTLCSIPRTACQHATCTALTTLLHSSRTATTSPKCPTPPLCSCWRGVKVCLRRCAT